MAYPLVRKGSGGVASFENKIPKGFRDPVEHDPFSLKTHPAGDWSAGLPVQVIILLDIKNSSGTSAFLRPAIAK